MIHIVSIPEVATLVERVGHISHEFRELGKQDVGVLLGDHVVISAMNLKNASTNPLAASIVVVAPLVASPWAGCIVATSILNHRGEVVGLDDGLGHKSNDSLWGCNFILCKDCSSGGSAAVGM